MASIISFSPTTKIKSADVNANFTNLANGSAMQTPTIDSMSITTLKQVSGFYDNGNSGATPTITWSNGDRQKITVNAGTTISFAGALAGQVLVLYVVENSTGNFSISMPSMKWSGGVAGIPTTTLNAINIYTIFYDGANYCAQLSPGYA